MNVEALMMCLTLMGCSFVFYLFVHLFVLYIKLKRNKENSRIISYNRNPPDMFWGLDKPVFIKKSNCILCTKVLDFQLQKGEYIICEDCNKKPIERYSLWTTYSHHQKKENLKPDKDGEWVKYEDIKELIKN